VAVATAANTTKQRAETLSIAAKQVLRIRAPFHRALDKGRFAWKNYPAVSRLSWNGRLCCDRSAVLHGLRPAGRLPQNQLHVHTLRIPSHEQEPLLSANSLHFRGSPRMSRMMRMPNIRYIAYSGKAKSSSKVVSFGESPWPCRSEVRYPVIVSPIVFICKPAFR
jgi:hypothetical protein